MFSFKNNFTFFSLIFFIFIFFLFLFFFSESYNPFLSSAWAITGEEILIKCDNIRNPQDSFFMNVTVTDEKEKKISQFEVYTKGREKTLIKTVLPSKDIGRDLLMIGDNMWAYIPNLKRSVRISLSQKLTGQTANGDISRMRWSGDYDVTEKQEEKESYQLYLTAKKERNNLTYSKIKVTIDKKNYRPLKATYLTLADKELKRAYFDEFKKIAGEIRPTKITIENALDPKDRSIISINEMILKKIDDNIFDKDK